MCSQRFIGISAKKFALILLSVLMFSISVPGAILPAFLLVPDICKKRLDAHLHLPGIHPEAKRYDDHCLRLKATGAFAAVALSIFGSKRSLTAVANRMGTVANQRGKLKAMCAMAKNQPLSMKSSTPHCAQGHLMLMSMGSIDRGYWDPLGFSANGDDLSFTRRCDLEIEHGRVAMYTCIGNGMLTYGQNSTFTWIPHGMKTVNFVPNLGWLHMMAFCGMFDIINGWNKYVQDRVKSGEYAWHAITNDTQDGNHKKLQAELASSRLVLCAITGMFCKEGLPGRAWGRCLDYLDPPLRAFENELGVQPPIGFWDPVGFTKDADVELFRRRREVERKHARVSMIACIGYFVPEYFKWPGYVSNIKQIKFDYVPNGLNAIMKVPWLGWMQIALFCGLVDVGFYASDPTRDPGDYENAGIMGVPNAGGPMSNFDERKTKLNAELANGRLAMIAIMGMLFQDGTVGSTGPAMWLPWEIKFYRLLPWYK